MFKIIDCGSYFDQEEPQVKVVTPGDTSALVKQAAHDEITKYVSGLQPQVGKIYLHINAMGAGEYFGSNKNGDYFPEYNLKQWYKTFETSPAHVFRHHINKDPAKAIGKVLFAIYNERMHRVELIAEVDTSLGADIEAKLAKGEYPQTSMACRTPYDECSICGNKAHTRQEYCMHLTAQLNQYLPDGRRVMAMNVAPLRFFDISIVIKPADITSSVLQKVASYGYATVDGLSVDTAAELGFVEKRAATIKKAAVDKLAELTKIIDGEVTQAEPVLDSILANVRDPEDEILNTLAKFPLEEVFNALAEAKIIPTVRFMADLFVKNQTGHEQHTGLGHLAEQVLQVVGVENIPVESINLLPDIVEKEPNPILVKVIAPAVPGSSLSTHEIEKRAYQGYMNWQAPASAPGATPEQQIQAEVEKRVNAASQGGFLKSLLVLAGTAFLSRMYIRSLMSEKEARLNEKMNRFRAEMRNSAKIGISKLAEYQDLIKYAGRGKKQNGKGESVEKSVDKALGHRPAVAKALKVLISRLKA